MTLCNARSDHEPALPNFNAADAGSHSLAAAGHRERSAYSESIETRPVTGEVV